MAQLRRFWCRLARGHTWDWHAFIDTDRCRVCGVEAWHWQETDLYWQLFHGNYQIIKAPKHSDLFAEYWPTPAQSVQIVRALNRP